MNGWDLWWKKTSRCWYTGAFFQTGKERWGKKARPKSYLSLLKEKCQLKLESRKIRVLKQAVPLAYWVLPLLIAVLCGEPAWGMSQPCGLQLCSFFILQNMTGSDPSHTVSSKKLTRIYSTAFLLFWFWMVVHCCSDYETSSLMEYNHTVI